MKKIVVMIMAVVMMVSMCACAATTSVTSEVVEAVVTDTSSSTNLRVEYGGVHTIISDGDLYEQYHNNLGTIIRMVLITRTYENGTVKQTLVFNENVHNGGGLK